MDPDPLAGSLIEATRELIETTTTVDRVEMVDVRNVDGPGDGLRYYTAVGWLSDQVVDIASHPDITRAITRLARQLHNGFPCPECGRTTVLFDELTPRTSAPKDNDARRILMYRGHCWLEWRGRYGDYTRTHGRNDGA